MVNNVNSLFLTLDKLNENKQAEFINCEEENKKACDTLNCRKTFHEIKYNEA